MQVMGLEAEHRMASHVLMKIACLRSDWRDFIPRSDISSEKTQLDFQIPQLNLCRQQVEKSSLDLELLPI